VEGHAHFLTFSCFRRQAFFSGERAKGWFVEAVRGALEQHDFLLWAWVIMPEHAHLLVCPREKTYRVSLFLRSAKQPVTNKALAHVRKCAPGFLERMLEVQPGGRRGYRFWQRGGGYDTNLWTPRHIWEKIAYIHRNPVRRRLVKRAEEWEWSSARDYAGVREVPLLPVDRGAVPFWEREGW